MIEVLTPLHALAAGCTLFRLWHRYRKSHLWWDDFWAAMSLSSDLVYAVMPFLRNGINETSGPPPSSEEAQIIGFWLGAVSLELILWFARISIGMSIARLVPPQTRARYLLHFMASQPKCPVLRWKLDGVLTLCTDFLADTCLVTIPLRMLWRVKLPKTQRRLILSIFASSFVTSLLSIVFVIFVFLRVDTPGQESHNWGVPLGLVVGIRATITLLVCNFLVIVMFLYRVFRKDEDDGTASEPSETRMLTEMSRPRGYSRGSGLSEKSIPFMPSMTFEKESSITPPIRRLSLAPSILDPFTRGVAWRRWTGAVCISQPASIEVLYMYTLHHSAWPYKTHQPQSAHALPEIASAFDSPSFRLV
ncbi:hypothetical protein LshimejAT787_0212050 [Lyophyllum shimeji]|uniref:Integral membrane protein n=1 Tax=Lyophyllum shimeji TaxID=47721 RepID=A0A9P3PGJ0_LYOSH|nr:hypothetical protein LshimejAT787_0212050 [Lyophyllum shimeji]